MPIIVTPIQPGPTNPFSPTNPSNPVNTNPSGGGGSGGGGGSNPNPTGPIPPSISNGLGGTLVYPPELATGEIRMAFSFYKYHKESLYFPTKFSPLGNTIFMPVPDGIIDSYTIGYEQYNPEWKAEYIAEAQNYIEGVKNWSVGSWWERVKNSPAAPYVDPNSGKSLTELIYDKSSARDAAFGIAAAGSKLGGLFDAGVADNATQNIFGTILNPNTTVAFKAPALRAHNFSWIVAPKSSTDSTLIMNIVNEFKYHMLPDTNDSGILLNYPDIIYPEFIGTGNYLYTFKPCVITGFAAVPVGAGQPSFFTGTHAPTHIQISIQLLETVLFLKKSVGLLQDVLAQSDLGDFSTAETLVSSPTIIDDSNVLPLPKRQ